MRVPGRQAGKQHGPVPPTAGRSALAASAAARQRQLRVDGLLGVAERLDRQRHQPQARPGSGSVGHGCGRGGGQALCTCSAAGVQSQAACEPCPPGASWRGSRPQLVNTQGNHLAHAQRHAFETEVPGPLCLQAVPALWSMGEGSSRPDSRLWLPSTQKNYSVCSQRHMLGAELLGFKPTWQTTSVLWAVMPGMWGWVCW